VSIASDLEAAAPHLTFLIGIAAAVEALDGQTINLNANLDMQRLADDVHAELLKKEGYNVKLGLA
jgi:hypothetical protein